MDALQLIFRIFGMLLGVSGLLLLLFLNSKRTLPLPMGPLDSGWISSALPHVVRSR